MRRRRRDVAVEELFLDFKDFDDSWLVLSLNEAVLRARGITVKAVIHLFFLVSRELVWIQAKKPKRRVA